VRKQGTVCCLLCFLINNESGDGFEGQVNALAGRENSFNIISVDDDKIAVLRAVVLIFTQDTENTECDMLFVLNLVDADGDE